MPPRRSKKDSTLSRVQKEIAEKQARLEQEMLKLKVVIDESPKRLQELQQREQEERHNTIRGRIMERPGSLVDPRHAGTRRPPTRGSRGSSGRNVRGSKRRGTHVPAVLQFFGMSVVLLLLLAIAIHLLS